jgi:SAM-dependent methyltransferase
MYDFIHDISVRPEPFSRYTAKALWTKPYLSRQMLMFHLSQETDLASRRFEVIDDVVRWINDQVDLKGKSLCDLGCGPGLYTSRFSQICSHVTGVDFSQYSLDYATEHSDKYIRYIQADYLSDDLPSGFDVITLIYTDLCVLSPNQRAILLNRIKQMLNPNGRLVLDVAGIGLLKSRQDVTLIEERLMNGFWAEGDYVGIQKSFVYEELNLALDRYIIVEPDQTWQIFNWYQHFTVEMIERELNRAGFQILNMAGDLTGPPLESESDFIGIIAQA